MGISENTVEAQMTIAFRKLRSALSLYLPQTRKKNTAISKKSLGVNQGTVVYI
jgi:hypothetical protein